MAVGGQKRENTFLLRDDLPPIFSDRHQTKRKKKKRKEPKEKKRFIIYIYLF